MHIAGLVDMLPASTADALKQAADATRGCVTGCHLTLCVGYGGRQEITEAVRALLHEQAAAGRSLAELAAAVTEDDIARHLSGDGQPEPDLIIRTSGEQRMSNFLLWQSTGAYLHFCDCYWPAFGEVDFLRALRDFAAPIVGGGQLSMRVAVFLGSSVGSRPEYAAAAADFGASLARAGVGIVYGGASVGTDGRPGRRRAGGRR